MRSAHTATLSVLSRTAPRRLLLVRGPQSSRSIALTFEGGPDPVHTPRLLETLRRERICATFFLLGARAAAHPELVRRIADDGHELASHSWAQERFGGLGLRALVHDLQRTAGLLLQLGGRRPRLFRPPAGKVGPGQLALSWYLQQTVVLWSVEVPSDGAVGAHPFRAGDIVLLNDSGPQVEAAISRVAIRARAQRLRFDTVGRMTGLE